MISACKPLAAKIFHCNAPNKGRQQIVLLGYAIRTFLGPSWAAKEEVKRKDPSRTIESPSFFLSIDLPPVRVVTERAACGASLLDN
jgi:hypothetical protein